jgi:hypothetical protein
MALFSNKSLYALCGLLAFFVFTGDLVMDAAHDATGGCVAESQSGDHDSCPSCVGCAIHTGTVIAADTYLVIPARDGACAPVPDEIGYWAAGLPAAIDHPPQLA